MGIYAKRPFAVAPYMGENAFVAYTVVQRAKSMNPQHCLIAHPPLKKQMQVIDIL